MPGLHNEAVFRQHIAKDNDLVVRTVIARQNLAYRGHPAADEAFKALVGALLREFLEVLDRMIRSRIAAGINRHRVAALARTDEGIPRRPGVRIVALAMRGVHRRRGFTHVVLFGIAVREQLIREQIWAGHADVFDVEPEMLRPLIGKCSFRGLRQNARGAAGRNESDDAITHAEVFIDGPCLALAREAGSIVVWPSTDAAAAST